MSSSLVLDNGGSTIKAFKFAHDQDTKNVASNDVLKIPNQIVKTKSERQKSFIGNEIDEIVDCSSLFYELPTNKGYIINWDIQFKVWSHIFSSSLLDVDFASTDLLLTQPYYNFSYLQHVCNEVIFEEFGFASLFCTTPAYLAKFHYQKIQPEKVLACAVVDSGYSFSHVQLFDQDDCIKKMGRRIDVGGKLLTNHLKELISYRQLNVMEETYIVNKVKEESCFVALNFNKSLEEAKFKRSASREYVLPDYVTSTKGYLKSHEESMKKVRNESEQVIFLNNERFTLPEILFHPSDILIDQSGICESLVEVVSKMEEEKQPHFYKNILLLGGSTLFPNFKKRFQEELREMCCDYFPINVVHPQDPIAFACLGGVEFIKTSLFSNQKVTRSEYLEHGDFICTKRFKS